MKEMEEELVQGDNDDDHIGWILILPSNLYIPLWYFGIR